MEKEDYEYYENEKDLEVGENVIVISDCNSKGKIGTVVLTQNGERSWTVGSTMKTYVTVEFDNKYKQSFNQRNLKPIREGEKMEINEVKSDYVVGVKFKSGYDNSYKGQTYRFLCYLKDFKVEDLVIVDTKNGYSIGKIVWIYTKEECLEKRIYTTKQIVCKLDDKEYLIRKEQEKLEKQKEEARKEIQLKINKRVEELKTEYVLEVLSQVDTELKSLLNEYNEI